MISNSTWVPVRWQPLVMGCLKTTPEWSFQKAGSAVTWKLIGSRGQSWGAEWPTSSLIQASNVHNYNTSSLVWNGTGGIWMDVWSLQAMKDGTACMFGLLMELPWTVGIDNTILLYREKGYFPELSKYIACIPYYVEVENSDEEEYSIEYFKNDCWRPSHL